MKTDNKLNRLIAERVMGWQWVQHSPKQEQMPGYESGRFRFLANPQWVAGLGVDQSWVIIPADMSRPIIDQQDVPNYCTDPAAWASLFVWLAEQGHQPELRCYPDKQYSAWLLMRPEGLAFQDTPGRALVLATLAAYGVDIED